jgi:hypothetical protein
LSVERSSQTIGQLKLGMRAGGSFHVAGGTLSPHVDAALERNGGDLTWVGSARFAGGANSFDSIAPTIDPRSFDVDAGLDFTSGPLTLSGSYRGRIERSWPEHTARISASLRF